MSFYILLQLSLKQGIPIAEGGMIKRNYFYDRKEGTSGDFHFKNLGAEHMLWVFYPTKIRDENNRETLFLIHVSWDWIKEEYFIKLLQFDHEHFWLFMKEDSEIESSLDKGKLSMVQIC